VTSGREVGRLEDRLDRLEGEVSRLAMLLDEVGALWEATALVYGEMRRRIISPQGEEKSGSGGGPGL
jgi:hypothetical protein